MNEEQQPSPIKRCPPSLIALTLVAKFHDLAIDAPHLAHEFDLRENNAGFGELLRVAKYVGLKAKKAKLNPKRLDAVPVPAICKLDGQYALLLKVDGERVLVHDIATQSQKVVARDEFLATSDSNLLLVTRRADRKANTGRFGIAWFVPALLKYKRLIGQVIVASFVVQILALVTPLFFQVVIDKVLVHKGFTTLDVLGVGLLAVTVFEIALNILRHYVFGHTTHRVDAELGAKLYRHLQHLPIAYFHSRSVGVTVAKVRELDSIRQFLTGSALTVAVDAVFVFVFLAVMYFYSPALLLIVLGSIPLYAILALGLTPRLRQRAEEKFARGAENQAFLVETVSGAQTVKCMAVEPQMQRRWEEQLSAYVGATFRSNNLANVAGQFAAFINKMVTVLILWIGARFVISGDLTVGQLIAFNMLAGRVGGPILKLAQLWHSFLQVKVSIDKLGDILNVPTERGSGGQGASSTQLKGAISLQDVTFRYGPDLPDALDSVSLDIAPGELVGIVGPSGSGKSTLASLIQRLHVPKNGRIQIDGTDIALIDPSSLRRQIGVVLQDSFLFRRSVRDNIALACPGIEFEKIVEAATNAGAHEFISALPSGYDTILEEQGSNLSGGQRQRIAIARALIGDPQILIFDEATSALDYESERTIRDNMDLICKDRTVIIIAHRLTTVRNCDRIVVMEGGRVSEQGSHEDLICTDNKYSELYKLQAV